MCDRAPIPLSLSRAEDLLPGPGTRIRGLKEQHAAADHHIRWYRTSEIVPKMHINVLDVCWRCGKETGSLFHMFWMCPGIRSYWNRVLIYVNKLTDIKLCNSQTVCLLHLMPMGNVGYGSSLLCYLINGANACFSGMWKSPMPPSIHQ